MPKKRKNNTQFGFKSKARTVGAISDILSEISYHNEKLTTPYQTTFVDISDAFD